MCATSIGSTFSQIPVPGVRKSGIPLGTEIPAPVSATVQLDSRISSANRRAWDAGADAGAIPEEPKNGSGVLRGWPPSRPSLPTPFRAALAEEGRDALLAVVREEGGREPLLLGLDSGVEIAVVGHRLDLFHCDRRLSGQLPGPGESGVEELLVRDQLVGKPVQSGLRGQ